VTTICEWKNQILIIMRWRRRADSGRTLLSVSRLDVSLLTDLVWTVDYLLGAEVGRIRTARKWRIRSWKNRVKLH
jgi:hypothetical protein